MMQKEIQIYTAKNGNFEVQVNPSEDTVWLTQSDMIQLFARDQSVISRHIRNIFSEGELDEKSNMQKMHIANSDKPVVLYNLDVIISVGYRVKSQEGTHFRIWANKILKEYLIQGYVVNEKRLTQREKGYIELEHTMTLVKKAIGSGDISSGEALGLLDIITGYTTSWLLLQKYDEKSLPEIGVGRTLIYRLDVNEAYRSIIELKKSLMLKHEATELFAHLREVDGLKGIFGNIYQTYDGKELYPTLESKAAHLLYFIIKDHPFIDGNKRSAAFVFILFLAKNNILFDEKHKRKVNDRGLVAITLLIAESNPKDKEVMIQVVMNLIL